VFAAAQNLPERERQILYLRFGEDLTQLGFSGPVH
jgi:DNA-directed RNA polymerase specialized sigma subunit